MENNNKQELRRYYLKIRKNLSKEEVENKSNLLIKKLQKFLNFSINAISFYVPINNEVDLLPYAKLMFESNKAVLFPKIINGKLFMCKVNDFQYGFVKGAYNIPEPDGRIYDEFIDVVLVPGIVFGKNGYRIGYGKGYYDEFLYRINKSKKFAIGIAYNFQLINEVPHSENDYKLDYIITENEIVRIINE